MKVTLLTHTPEPEKTIAMAGKLCYSKKISINDLATSLTDEEVSKFVKQIMKMSHDSVLEHASFTFGIEGVSRALLAEITRHRIGCSFSVRSQRYCGEERFDYVTPKTLSEEQFNNYDNLVNSCKREYAKMVNEGVPKEDARMVLPNATHTRMIVTMNVRALHHFFNLRCCTRAQWEIRELANIMLKLCKEVSPLLFENAGPSCVKNGYCPEAGKCCGRAPTLDALLKNYKH